MLEFIQNIDFALHIIRTEQSESDWAITIGSHVILITNQENNYRKHVMQHTAHE